MPDNKTKPLPELTREYADSFWSKIDIRGPEECWPWKASSSRGGYGYVRIKGGAYAASRIAFRLYYGSDPHPCHILHRCDNPKCTNPNCFFLGQHLENSRDAKRKGRTAFGERHSQAVLTEAQVMDARRRRANGDPIRPIAEEFGVDIMTISKATRESWPHLPFLPIKRRFKISQKQIREAKRLHAAGMSQRQIAFKFGVSPALICLIFKGKARTSQ